MLRRLCGMLEESLNMYFRFRRSSFILWILVHLSRTMNLRDVVTHFFIKVLMKGVRWHEHVSDSGGGIWRSTLSWTLLINARLCSSFATSLSVAPSTAVTYWRRDFDGLISSDSAVYFLSNMKEVVVCSSVRSILHCTHPSISGRNLFRTDPRAYKNPSSWVPLVLYVGLGSIRMKADAFSSRWSANLAGWRVAASSWSSSAAWKWPGEGKGRDERDQAALIWWQYNNKPYLRAHMHQSRHLHTVLDKSFCPTSNKRFQTEMHVFLEDTTLQLHWTSLALRPNMAVATYARMLTFFRAITISWYNYDTISCSWPIVVVGSQAHSQTRLGGAKPEPHLEKCQPPGEQRIIGDC